MASFSIIYVNRGCVLHVCIVILMVVMDLWADTACQCFFDCNIISV